MIQSHLSNKTKTNHQCVRQTKPSHLTNHVKCHPGFEFKQDFQSLQVFNARKIPKTFVTVLSLPSVLAGVRHSVQVIELRMFFQLQLVQNVTVVQHPLGEEGLVLLSFTLYPFFQWLLL